jgi:hypothetical protein
VLIRRPTGLRDFGLLGLSTLTGDNGIPLRPSPLGMGNGFTASEPSSQPPYVQFSQSHLHNQHAHMRLSIPVNGVPEHQSLSTLSPVGQMQNSPIDMSTVSGGPNTPARLSPSNSGQHYYDHSMSTSSSASGLYQTGQDDGLWNFGASGDGGFEGISLVVPAHTVSAPASAHPSSRSAYGQQSFMMPAPIPGKLTRYHGTGQGGSAPLDMSDNGSHQMSAGHVSR